ncbi:oocyte zinc finger protein XlCOF6-like isoform X1 [Macrosteles quadrilineatus]|uniref:oocyte zinc finger protein XlCOF6-like isoform X1 n=1 Tax=Macrosteles quadrilineatus TaxID=74068 RepID=UPI0023E15307|nr:oocyte zinc finger protein XlCOF6-like isoform X1 [Macrosteles quadrilineatus]XP_054263729.1 oocyte zinc finger protein XlCOF6-like isoform X1 [Macrosteles quadrilineatus]XP_054263730.1 oocyte zinc finger protein XlCOF6-like isoform X1 [Macrosteles quadrilineatus]
MSDIDSDTLGVHIKKELSVYEDVKESKWNLVNLSMEAKEVQIWKNEISTIKDLKIKSKTEINNDETPSTVESKSKLFVKIKRNNILEQALKEEMKNLSQGGRYFSQGKTTLNQFPETSLNTELPQVDEKNIQPHLKMFVCVDCNRCYRREQQLTNHKCEVVKTCSEDDIPSSGLKCNLNATNLCHICQPCGKSFKSKKSLRAHKACHSNSFACASCNMQFDKKYLLINHCRSHFDPAVTTEKCAICKHKIGKEFPMCPNVYCGLKTFPHPCSQCAKRFPTRQSLKIHLLSHSSEKNYKCTHCRKLFKYKNSLRIHFNLLHTQSKNKFSCDECSKSFVLQQVLKNHKLKAHSKDRPLSCVTCEATFNDRKCLKVHCNTHTGIKSHSCSFCSKTFAQLSHLKRHERLHTGVKPYKCKICDKSFRDSSNFKVHQIIHSGLRPFKCDECGKAFTQRSHLNTHKQTHNKARPYKCNICGDSFKKKDILRTHVFLHSDVKPFNCEQCGKSYVQHTAFKLHKCPFSA